MNTSTDFEKLIEHEAKEVICKSCYAHYDIRLSECPYCKTSNELGMEVEYMDSLNSIKDNLSNMADYAENEYKKEAKSILKKIMIPVVTILATIGIVVFAFQHYMKAKDVENAKKAFLWQQENYPIADELYENGDYDAMIDFMDASTKDIPYEIASYGYWEHYDFSTFYRYYDYLKGIEAYPDDEEYVSNSNKESAFYYAMYACYEAWETKLNIGRISKKEYEIILQYQSDVKEYMLKNFGITDLDEVSKDCMYDPPGVGVDYSKCKEVSKGYNWIY